jgi:glycosyltransferase involved in cell wall biosynthesis
MSHTLTPGAGGEQQITAGVSIVIPAYNEEAAIGAVLGEIKEAMAGSPLPWEIVVVDDGSTDQTAGAVQSSGDAAAIRLLRHERNRGYGAALKTGIRHACHDAIVITDADGTYPNERIPELVGHLGEYDMVVGARTGEDVRFPLLRRPAKWALNQLANYLAGMTIPDLNSGLRAMKRDVLLKFFNMLPAGFSFTTTITLAMLTNNYNVKYVPINYGQRLGQSKIKPVKDTLGFVMLIVRVILLFAPLRVLGSLGLVLLLVGSAKLLYDLLAYRFHVATSTIVVLMTALQVIVLGLVADLIVSQRE